MFELLEWQLVLVGLLASGIVQLIRFLGDKYGVKIGKVTIQWALFGISLALGLWWGTFSLPAFPVFGGPESIGAFVEFAAEIIALIGQLLGVAYVVYNVVTKKVFDAIEPLRL